MNIQTVNNKRLSLIKKVLNRVISKVAYTEEVGLKSAFNVEKLEYLTEQVMEGKHAGLSFVKEEQEILFHVNSSLTMINASAGIDSPAANDDVDAIADKLSPTYVGFLRTVKHNIIPMMDRISGDLIQGLAGSTEMIKTNKITLVSKPELFANLGEHKGLELVGNGLIPSTPFTLPVPEVAEIRAYFNTDSDDINYDLEPILKEHSDEDLIKLWETYIYSFDSDNFALSSLSTFTIANADKLALLFAAFRKMLKSGHSALETSSAFEGRIINGLDAIKAMITKFNRQYEYFIDNEVVVARMDRAKDISYCVSENYNRFLEASNWGVDSLLGFAVSKRSQDSDTIRLQELLDNEERYYNEFKSYFDIKKLEQIKSNEMKAGDTYRVSRNKIYNELKSLSFSSGTFDEESFTKFYNGFVNRFLETSSDTMNATLFVTDMFKAYIPSFGRFLAISDNLNRSSDATPVEIALYTIVTMITEDVSAMFYLKEVEKYKV